LISSSFLLMAIAVIEEGTAGFREVKGVDWGYSF